jgi:type IV pilus assembly protein PilB
MDLIQELVKKGVIDKYQVDEIIELAAKEEKSIEKVLRDMEIEDSVILDAKSSFFGVPKKQINYEDVRTDVVKMIPEDTSRVYKMVAFNMGEDGVLEVGMLDPRNTEARNVLQFITSETNTPFRIYIITEEAYERISARYRGLSGEVGTALDQYADINEPTDLEDPNLVDIEDQNLGEKITEDAPVTKMVASIIKHAVSEGASDIHIEHLGEIVKIRFRIDGVLSTYLELPKTVHSAIIARIKIMTKSMKLDERRRPQDGRFPSMIDGRKVDFRISIMPTFFGEKAVIRVLDSAKGVRDLDTLEITEKQRELLYEAINRPYGLILITGPTGSGKTTTLYSMLNKVDRDRKNVVSLEDPIEYQLPGVNQSQVRADIGYTFANGLRSIVRQDPDVIMVGEIRDKETANLAIQAALTGHLVFATLHTNSSFGIIPRLVEMGVDPYLIAPTLILGIAQRLLRRVAPEAAVPHEKQQSFQAMIEKQFEDYPEEFKSQIDFNRPVMDVQPTRDAPTGMKGRVAVMEMFKVDQEIESIILNNPTEQAIYEAARKKGMITLKESAILKGLEGLVPFSEINSL